mgnify:CR=1 FL=1
MAKRQTSRPPRLQEGLVLHKYILSLFGCKDLEKMSEDLKDPTLEGIDDEGVSRLYPILLRHMYNYKISSEKLFEYDQNIVRHTRAINERRTEKIQWKYYQYLALLFTEIYLDKYFADRNVLLNDINRFLTDDFNFRSETWHSMPEFTDNDLNKLAFWCATGSGKTLMMHVNIKQYLHYTEKYNGKKLNRIIILTPNEGLSKQHLNELEASNFEASLFSKQTSTGLFKGKGIDIIDINKLADSDGDKTVAVESFEGNNLVLVDEGHRGSGGEVWKGYRNVLTTEGFSFEYSATFGQAIAAQTGKNREALLQEYGKTTLFDYSYRYFYSDGYGKDYRIMNMASWDDESLLNMYLTAYLLSLYEQMLAFDSTPLMKNKFLIARPLGIFVGGSVNAVRKQGGRDVSDVVAILLFIQQFIENPNEFTGYIRSLLEPNNGIKNPHGYSLFAGSFQLTKEGMKLGEEEEFARNTYYKVIEKLFHSSVPGAHLHVDKQKGGEKEIALRIGSAPYFGVINVGDSDNLIKLCEANGLLCDSLEFGTSSLFNGINSDDSSINLLIGSKKFNEGWSSWRVSAMGLMNVGRSEGSEIIQLFGRGVRLKGFQYSLKRSNALDSSFNPGNLPRGLHSLETLNIFGVRADYMDAFRKYLKDDGLPANEESFTQINIPTVNLLGNQQLKVVRLKEGYNFKKEIVVNPIEDIAGINVRVDFLKKVEALWSDKAGVESAAELPKGKLSAEHLALLDWRRIFFAIERMKNERSWWNMEINIEMLQRLMERNDWYELLIEPVDLEFRDYGRDVPRWEEITIALLRAFIDRSYKRAKGRWESKYMETVYLSPNDPNFFEEYAIEVRSDQTMWIEKLKELREQIKSGIFERDLQISGDWIQALRFDRHLFFPLLCLREKNEQGHRKLIDPDTHEPLIKISPVALNPGETEFVKAIRDFYNLHCEDILKGKEIYLLRNESRKGIGFFEASNFYPDFILWVNDGKKQHVTFLDPKGIRNLKGLDDPKIQLYKTLKTEVEPSLNDSDIILDSYILSNTPYKEVSFWTGHRKEVFDENHVLFVMEENYIDELFKKIFF